MGAAFVVVTLSGGAARAQAASPNTGSPLVLIVPTRGNASWLAAERRLAAELQSLQLRVSYGQVVREFDTTLPERAHFARALVAIQVLREADLGILRFWFTPQPGRQSGYQHVEVNLRNADVVSSAVLPVVEAIFDRVEATAEARPTAVVSDSVRRDDSSSDEGADECTKNKGQRCAPGVAGRVFLGPYFATAAPGAVLAAGVGARWRVWPHLTLEADVDYQALIRPSQASLHNQTTAQLHVMYELRNRVGRGVAVGPGVGAFLATTSEQTYVVPRVSLRGEMFVPLSARTDLVVGATVARAWGLPSGTQHGGFFASAMVGIDLNFN